jgi:gas vesicle protein
VNERQILMIGGVIGAFAGVLTTYLYFTESGRRFREDAEGSMGALMEEAERLLSAADQVRQSVADIRGKQTGWARSA